MYLLSFHVHLLSLLLLLSACELWIPSTAKGLRKTPLGHGPKVIYDLHTHSPMSVPFPNDDLMYYTRQTTSKQLLHLQPIFLSSTILGQNLQNQLNQIDAFPIHTPITVRFDQAIDIKDLWSRHNIHDPSNQRYRDDFRDDV